jgi:hypothetical protein
LAMARMADGSASASGYQWVVGPRTPMQHAAHSSTDAAAVCGVCVCVFFAAVPCGSIASTPCGPIVSAPCVMHAPDAPAPGPPPRGPMRHATHRPAALPHGHGPCGMRPRPHAPRVMRPMHQCTGVSRSRLSGLSAAGAPGPLGPSPGSGGPGSEP